MTSGSKKTGRVAGRRGGGLTVVALHTDFRLYWPARWQALGRLMRAEGAGRLEVVEIFGRGSPYSFDSRGHREAEMPWHVLFEDAEPGQISGRRVKPHLFRLLDSINPDVVMCGAIAFVSGALAVQWALARPDKRVVCFDDARLHDVVRSSSVNRVKRCVYDCVDAMFYPAPQWEETGRSWGFGPDRLFYGVDTVDRDFWQTAAGPSDIAGPYFLAVGRQVPAKNFLTALRAYALYVRQTGRCAAASLVMAGDGPERPLIEKYLADTGLEDKVRLLPFSTREELRSLMQHAELLMVPGAETWGLVVNEALDCGCPVLATDRCGAASVLLRDRLNGYMVPYGDTAAMARCLAHYRSLSDTEKAAMRRAARQSMEGWGLERFARSALDAVLRVAAGPKRNGTPLSRTVAALWHGRYAPV